MDDPTSTLDSLHPLEVKVLTVLRQSEEPITDSQLIEATQLEASQVSMAIGWLLTKGLLMLSSEQITPVVSLTKTGQRYYESASPSEWILQSIQEGQQSGQPVSVQHLQAQAQFQPTELSRAVGLLKKDGALRLASGGAMEVTETPSPTTETLRSLLNQLHGGPQNLSTGKFPQWTEKEASC